MIVFISPMFYNNNNNNNNNKRQKSIEYFNYTIASHHICDINTSHKYHIKYLHTNNEGRSKKL